MKIVSASWSWQEIKTQEANEFMAAYITTCYGKRQKNTSSPFGVLCVRTYYIWLNTKIVF